MRGWKSCLIGTKNFIEGIGFVKPRLHASVLTASAQKNGARCTAIVRSIAAGKAIDMPANAVDDAVRSELLRVVDVILPSFEQIKTHRAGPSKPAFSIVTVVTGPR